MGAFCLPEQRSNGRFHLSRPPVAHFGPLVRGTAAIRGQEPRPTLDHLRVSSPQKIALPLALHCWLPLPFQYVWYYEINTPPSPSLFVTPSRVPLAYLTLPYFLPNFVLAVSTSPSPFFSTFLLSNPHSTLQQYSNSHPPVHASLRLLLCHLCREEARDDIEVAPRACAGAERGRCNDRKVNKNPFGCRSIASPDKTFPSHLRSSGSDDTSATSFPPVHLARPQVKKKRTKKGWTLAVNNKPQETQSNPPFFWNETLDQKAHKRNNAHVNNGGPVGAWSADLPPDHGPSVKQFDVQRPAARGETIKLVGTAREFPLRRGFNERPYFGCAANRLPRP